VSHRRALPTAVAELFTEIGSWLDSRRVQLTGMRSKGLRVALILNGDVDQDQLDLDLEPEFLATCGLASVSIQIITNE